MASTPIQYIECLTELHIGRPIENIVKERFEKLKHNINRVIRIKEMDLTEKMRRLDKVVVQLRYVANYFNTTTANFFEVVVHDMNSIHEKKKSAVNVALGSIQEDVHRMSKLIYETNYLVTNQRHIEFLDNFPRLIKQAEHLYFKKHEGTLTVTVKLCKLMRRFLKTFQVLSKISRSRGNSASFTSTCCTQSTACSDPCLFGDWKPKSSSISPFPLTL